MKKVFVMAVLASVLLAGTASAVLDRVYYGSNWTTANINSNNYQALAQERHNGSPTDPVSEVFTSNATDLTDRQRSADWCATWTQSDVVGIQYTEMATRHTADNQFYGLKTDGKIDLVYHNGSNWAVYASYTGTTAYKAITADYAANWIYAVRADGAGVDRLTISGAGAGGLTYNYFVGAYNFNEIETVTGLGDQFFGANADGTLDRIRFATSAFVKDDLSSDNYKALASDASTAVMMVYGARADGTGVDRIRYNGSAWVKDQSLLTTADYDELATVTGRTNQFYGSTIVPEPATLAILGLGGLLLSRRRK
jgi:hypothetical protein